MKYFFTTFLTFISIAFANESPHFSCDNTFCRLNETELSKYKKIAQCQNRYFMLNKKNGIVYDIDMSSGLILLSSIQTIPFSFFDVNKITEIHIPIPGKETFIYNDKKAYVIYDGSRQNLDWNYGILKSCWGTDIKGVAAYKRMPNNCQFVIIHPDYKNIEFVCSNKECHIFDAESIIDLEDYTDRPVPEPMNWCEFFDNRWIIKSE